MKKIFVIHNVLTGRKWGGTFYNGDLDGIEGESDAQVQARIDNWFSLMEAKASVGEGWGWGPRTINKIDNDGNPVTLDSELVPLILNETSEYWEIDKTYTVDEQDLTTEHNEELAEQAEDAVTLEEIKQAIDIINGWTQLSDININFLKKFFKYLIKKTI